MTRTWTKKLGLLAAMAIVGGMAMAPTAADASVDGQRNTAIALGLGTLYELSQHNNGAAAVLGIGTAVAAQQYDQARHDQSVCDNSRSYYYQNSGNGYDGRNGYRIGENDRNARPSDHDNDRRYDNQGRDSGRR